MQKKNEPKRILFVLEHFYPYIGGAENLFFLLTKGLVEKGFKVRVVTTKFDKKLPKKETYHGIEIIRVACFNRFAFTLFSLPKVYTYAREADFIHTTTYNAALPAALIGKLLKKPVIITFHEVWGALWKTLPFTSFFEKHLFYFFEKMLLKLPFAKFIAVSEYTKAAMIDQGIPEKKIARIYNGLDYKQYQNYTHTPPEQFTFTYFGRLGISKGLNLLIPAAAAFRQKHPNTTFNLITPKYPKPLYKKIESLISAFNVKDYIHWQHNLPQKELFGQLSQSSCIVIPSYSEGFCFAAVESVALGIPIVSSQQGALSETVSGMYIPMSAMDADALCTALEEAYHNTWNTKPVEYFHLSDSLNCYLTLYG